MLNKVLEGHTLQVVVPTGGCVSGAGLLVGVAFGVCPTTELAGASMALQLEGTYRLAKATGQVWTIGAAVYWDNSAKKCTTSSGGNTKIGVAANAALTGDTTGEVRLNGTF
jgi:predicted RecA/RadA family phage recombinase